MTRRNFNEGMEVTFEDLNKVSSTLEKQFYERVLYQMLVAKVDRFFMNGFLVTRVDATHVSVAPGLGIQEDAAETSPESKIRPLWLDAAVELEVSAPDGTLPRLDIVCVKHARSDSLTASRRFKDALTSDITTDPAAVVETDWEAECLVVTGTPNAAPTAPATPAGYVKIAEVTVSAITGIAPSAAITDSRVIVDLGADMEIDTTGYVQLPASATTRLKAIIAAIEAKLVAQAATNTAQATTNSNDLNRMAPVGSIVAYHPGYYADGSNGTFTLVGPATNDAAGINAYLPANWRVCNGAALNDAGSTIFNGSGRYLPNLTDSRFLRGTTASGGAADPTYTPSGAISTTGTFTGDAAARSGWFASGSYTPAGTNSGGAGTVEKDDWNSGQSSHSHSGTTMAVKADFGSGQVYVDAISTASWTPEAVFNFVSGTASGAARVFGTALLGNVGGSTVGWTVSAGTAPVTVTNPTFAGSSVLRTAWAAAGNYTPSGSISASSLFTGAAGSVEPKYLNVVYIMRVK